MSEVAALLVAVAGYTLSGAGLARGLGLVATYRGRLEPLAIAFGLGGLQATTLLFWASLAGVPLSFGLAWLVMVPGLLGWLRRAPRSVSIPRASGATTGRGWLTALLALFLLLGIGRAVATTFAEPVTWGDAFRVWQFKGRAFQADGEIRPVLESATAYQNRDYPLHVPLLSTHVYLLAGAPDDFLAKAIGLAYFLALLALAGAAFRRRVGRNPALFMAGMLAALPPLAAQVGGAIADLPFAFFLLGAALAVDAYARERTPRRLALAAAFLYGCLWTKNEGAAATCVALVVAVVPLAGARRWRDLVALAPLLLIIPWVIFRTSLGVPSDHLVGALAHGPGQALARVPEILTRAAGHLFGPEWLGLWAALLLLIGIRPRTLRRVWPLLTITAGVLAAYVAVLAITSRDFVWLIQTAFGRLLLHTAPVAAIVVAGLWAGLREPRPDAAARSDP